MLKEESNNMSLDNFLEELKMQYCSEQDLLQINNEFQNLKKGKISVNEYARTFIENMKLVPNLVPTEISKENKFAIRLPSDYGPMVKLATNLKASI